MIWVTQRVFSRSVWEDMVTGSCQNHGLVLRTSVLDILLTATETLHYEGNLSFTDSGVSQRIKALTLGWARFWNSKAWRMQFSG